MLQSALSPSLRRELSQGASLFGAGEGLGEASSVNLSVATFPTGEGLAARRFLEVCKGGRHDRGVLLILHYAASGKMAPSP